MNKHVETENSMKERFLFRAKRTDKDEWIGGFLFQLYNTVGFSWCIGTEPLKPNNCAELSGDGLDWCIIEPSTICQSTGVHDSTKWEELTEEEQRQFIHQWNPKEGRRNTKEDWKGKLIFENDIVNIVCEGVSYIYKIVWDSSRFVFRVTNGKDEYVDNFQYIACCDEIKVIGNTFENPEFLKD